MARVVAIDEAGAPVVALGVAGGVARVAARATIAVAAGDVGRDAVVAFEDGDRARPIVTGLLVAPAGDAASCAPTARAASPPRRVEIEAADELVLRCGAASVELRADGRIVILGGYVVSRATGAHRIQGGSVQIN
ncbi:MAG: DUF6484 domain-containing protein [Myxococcota bacterium]